MCCFVADVGTVLDDVYVGKEGDVDIELAAGYASTECDVDIEPVDQVNVEPVDNIDVGLA